MEQCIDELCNHETTGQQIHFVDRAVTYNSMNTSIVEDEDRAWSLRKEYSNALRSSGYAQIEKKKPHLAIVDFLSKLKNPLLYRRMIENIN